MIEVFDDIMREEFDNFDDKFCIEDCPFDCETECPLTALGKRKAGNISNIKDNTKTTKVIDNAMNRRNKNSATYKVRMLDNNKLITLTKMLFKTSSDYNIKYKNKARQIAYNPRVILDSNERIVLEAFCRGCKNLDDYLNKL